MDEQKTISSGKKYKLKKLVKLLKGIRGRHTELVTVYVPSGYSLHEINSQLKDEQGTAKNIKSKPVRNNVVNALEKIIRHIALYKKTPVNGLALFSGNVSEKEGSKDIELWAIEPPEPIKVKLYWCDQKFDTTPLDDMMKEKGAIAIVVLDKSEADLGLLVGKAIKPMHHFESIVPGKTRAGGQSSARFSRIREGLLNDWLKKIGEVLNKLMIDHKEVNGVLIAGPGPIKNMYIEGNYVQEQYKKKVVGIVDIGTTGEPGLHEAVERGQEFLRNAELSKEKDILQRFFNELQKTAPKVTYGINETIKAIELGAVDTIIISEDVDLEEVEYECDCGLSKAYVSEEKKTSQQCSICNKVKKLLGEKDIIEAMEELGKNYSSEVAVVSSETREGTQFLALGGVGALLRYAIEV
ncbi:peptide chain release factor 1 [archaeon]|nr:peptide chain release factor 1 [archaeon]